MLWKTTPVSEQPSLTLRDWAIFEVEDADGPAKASRHFAGYVNENGEGRASSEIVTFDKISRRGVTASGRVYELVGEPGLTGDAQYVWDGWKRINQIVKERDITKEIFE